jgi:hypothetical protein
MTYDPDPETKYFNLLGFSLSLSQSLSLSLSLCVCVCVCVCTARDQSQGLVHVRPLDFLEINIPVLILPNKSMWYPLKSLQLGKLLQAPSYNGVQSPQHFLLMTFREDKI